jgi:hypothetical protein
MCVRARRATAAGGACVTQRSPRRSYVWANRGTNFQNVTPYTQYLIAVFAVVSIVNRIFTVGLSIVM